MLIVNEHHYYCIFLMQVLTLTLELLVLQRFYPSPLHLLRRITSGPWGLYRISMEVFYKPPQIAITYEGIPRQVSEIIEIRRHCLSRWLCYISHMTCTPDQCADGMTWQFLVLFHKLIKKWHWLRMRGTHFNIHIISGHLCAHN